MAEEPCEERVILTPTDPLEWWRKEYTSRPLTGLVFERGDWCVYCRHDVNQWREQLPRLEALGGAFFIITAQDKAALQRSASRWGLDHLPIVSDPKNILARELGLHVSTTPVRPGVQSFFDSYKSGVCQPGYVIVNQDGAELAGWRQTPTEHNIGGALDRPIPSKVVDFVQSQVQVQHSEDGAAQDLRDPNEVLDDFARVIEEYFDEFPEDIQALLRQEHRLMPDSQHTNAAAAAECEVCA